MSNCRRAATRCRFAVTSCRFATTSCRCAIERNGVPLVRTTTPELTRIGRSAFALLLGGDSIDEVIRGVGEEAPEVVAR